MNGPDFLSQQAGVLRTKVGACYPGTHAVFRGHDLHRDLRDMDWVSLFVFGITGRRLEPAQVEMLNALWVYTSYPDTRLWNNRVAALSASARSSANLGLAAALALSEATVYGGGAGLRSITFLQQTATEVDGGADLATLVLSEARARRVYGYGRPINSTDERLPWIVALAQRLGLDGGRHYRLAFEVENILLPAFPKLRMNYAALHAALIADMGLSAREYQMLRLPTFLAGMPPCLVEAAAKPEGSLFPISCADIAYEGVVQRAWRR
jgi:hypothetical protein